MSADLLETEGFAKIQTTFCAWEGWLCLETPGACIAQAWPQIPLDRTLSYPELDASEEKTHRVLTQSWHLVISAL